MSALCSVYGINKWFIPLGRIAGSALTDLEGKLSGAGAVVPDRNAIMLRQAAALFPGPEAVVMGCCRDDWEVFEDCRPEFFEKMRAELAPCKVITPLIGLDKRGVYRFAQRYGGSALLDLSWSCYARPGIGAWCRDVALNLSQRGRRVRHDGAAGSSRHSAPWCLPAPLPGESVWPHHRRPRSPLAFRVGCPSRRVRRNMLRGRLETQREGQRKPSMGANGAQNQGLQEGCPVFVRSRAKD